MKSILRLGCLLVIAVPAYTQSFSSGSTGSDGALNYTTAGTYNFDPTAFKPALDPSGDNIFNFTTINIASGVTLTMQNSYLRGKPVIWLATGNVTIAGHLSLDGASGAALSTAGVNWITQRVPTEPGPGGYPGGAGAVQGSGPYPGLGPGGAPVQTTCGSGGGASYAIAGSSTPASQTYGSVELVPLIGGSGGSGGGVCSTDTAADAAGGSGGAGGGAIRIVSSTSISITGEISALWGSGGIGRSGAYNGGPGSSGAIHLIAPTVTGNGSLRADGGYYNQGAGYVTINAMTDSFTGTANGTYTQQPLFAPPLPTLTTPPTVTVVSVNGVSVPQPPQGQYLTPDITINSTTSVTINITASGVPVGTVVQLQIVSQLGSDQVVSCNPLAGTTASSTATCSAAFPTAVSAILASAVW